MFAGESSLHLALLASEQLLPNLESALALAGAGRLRGVHIYYTDDQLRSGQPAVGLRSILEYVSKRASLPPSCFLPKKKTLSWKL